MDVPADRSRPTSALPVDPSLREAVRSPRRRRPTGAAPPLPYRLQTSGIRWLVAALVLIGLTLVVFARGLRGPAVAVTVIDDAIVGWLAGLVGPGLVAPLRSLARISSWWVLYTLYFGLLLVLLVLRRWRHLILWLVVVQLGGWLTFGLAAIARRPRPFGDELGWLGDAVGAGRLPDRGPHDRAVHPGARGSLAQHRQVAGGWADHPGRRGPHRIGGGCPKRRAGRGGHRGHHPAVVVSPVRPQRGLPGRLPAGPQRPPGCWWGPWGGDPPGPSGSARPGRRRDQAVRPGRVGRLHPAADQGQGRSAPAAVRQAVRPEPPALGPLVQAGPRAALRPAGGREALQHRPPPGPAGGLRPAQAPPGRAAQPPPLRVRRADPGAGVPAGHRVLRRGRRARRGRGRRGRDRRRPGHHPQAVGRRAGPSRHQAGQPAGPRRPPAADRRRLRRGPPLALAAGGGSGQHDAVPGPAVQPRAGLPPSPPVLHRGGNHRGVRGRPRPGLAVPAAPPAPGPGPEPARRVRAPAAQPTPADPSPALERPPDRALGGDSGPAGPGRPEPQAAL